MAIQYFWRHPLAEQVREEGREQGREEGGSSAGNWGASPNVGRRSTLEWRDIPVPHPVRERVNSCTDLDQLKVWAQRAVRATDAGELFAER
ncbi:hypothetical protein ACIQVT_33850 [Streptomyces sp. NPDC100445]|uniref:hypothetical protein n=1 Tax=Streptomyces sp. NPDC100445 TaxID=3366102 RepID=UPI0037F17BE2